MDDTCVVALDHGFGYLPEEVLGQGFGKCPTLCDEVEQILRRFGPFHDQHENVVRVASVQQPHHAADVRHLTQQTHFQRHSQTTNLTSENNIVFFFIFTFFYFYFFILISTNFQIQI